MNDFPIQRFIQISKIDQSLMQLDQQIDQYSQEIQKNNLEIAKLNSVLEQQKLHKLELQKRVDQKELEMKILDETEREKKRKLDVAQSAREAQSLFLEIETLKKDQYKLEEDLLQAWHQFETAKKQFEQSLIQYDEQQKKLLETVEEKKTAIESLQKEIDNKKREKESLSQELPSEWVEKYAAMHNRVANPVVPVINGQCSACFYTISSQDLANLNKRILIQCKDCYRFLYLESAI